jgi:pilus assembly protein FimV
MARTLAVVLGAVCCLWASVVSALGLGEITLNSALNQSLDAEIRLFQVRDLSENEIIPRLASVEDFERVGVERFFFLTSLNFEVERRGTDDVVIHITSREPVTEPYLNFLVEVLWPSGRLLKEYTLLLDPPVLAQDRGVAPVSPGREMVAPDRGAGFVIREEAVEVPLPEQGVERPVPLPAFTKQERFKGDTYGMTDRDDTMWSIALMTRPSRDVSVQQTMLAYVRLNPEAFIGNNVNLVKAGFVLRVPTEDEIRQLSQAEAVAAVMRHNELWESYRMGEGIEPIDASEPSMSRTYAETGRDEGELRVVSSADAGSDAGTGASDVSRGTETVPRGASSSTQIGVDEERDRLARENDELRQSQRMLESQTDNIRRQLQIKDDQLAQLQQQLEQVRTQLEQAGEEPPPLPPPQPQPQTSTSTPEPPPAETTPAPTSGPVAALTKGPLAFVMDNILLVGGALALLILLFVALRMLAARREREAFGDTTFDEELPDEFDVFDSAEREAVVGADERSEQFLDLEEEEEPEALTGAALEFPLDEEELAGVGEDTAQPSDVVSEADIYIAYGRFPQAISFLENAIESEPERADVRLKLMEVYVETKDLDGFAEQGRELMALAGNDETLMRRARQLQARLEGADVIPTSGLDEDLDLSQTLVGVDEIAHAAREAVDEGEEEAALDLDLDLNLEDTDLEEGVQSADATLDFDLDLETDESGEDLDLSLDDDSGTSLSLEETEEAGDELDLELDEDAFTPATTTESPAVNLASSGEESLDEEDDALADLELEAFDADMDEEASSEPDEELLGISRETQEFDLSDLNDDQDDELERAMPEDLQSPATATEEFDLSDLDLDEQGSGGSDFDEELELLSDSEDETSTKLSLARAYIDMGDSDGARDILNEVIEEGSAEQQKEANELLSQLS